MHEFSLLVFFEWKIRSLADLVTKQITALLFLSETLPGIAKSVLTWIWQRRYHILAMEFI